MHSTVWSPLHGIVTLELTADAMADQVYYDDRAVFVNTTSGAKSLRHWIESAYMVVEAGLLKVKFISSTAVNW